MKSKSILLIAGSLALMSVVSNAATISLSRGTGNPGIIASVNGTPLSTGGYYIGVGTYASVPVVTTYETLLTAVDSFRLFASVVAPISGATIGTMTGSFTSLGGATPSDFNLQQMYFIVGNAATKMASTAWGIYSMTTPAFFPANVTAAGSTPVSIATVAAITPLANAGTVTLNSFHHLEKGLHSCFSSPSPPPPLTLYTLYNTAVSWCAPAQRALYTPHDF